MVQIAKQQGNTFPLLVACHYPPVPLAPAGAEDGSRGQARRAQPPVAPQEEMRPGRAAGTIFWPQSRGTVPAPFQGAPMPRRLPGARHATRVPAPGYHPWPRWGQQQQPEMPVKCYPDLNHARNRRNWPCGPWCIPRNDITLSSPTDALRN